MKCECGEKPHTKGDCVYLEKGDSKRELGLDGIDDTRLTITQWITMSAVVPTGLVASVR